MTADLDLSPEAVERLASDLDRSNEYEPLGHDGWTAAALLRALSVELAAARAETELMGKAIDEREIASGLSTNGGFWRWWAAQARDTAAKLDAARSENERLTVEIDRLAAALDEMTRRRNAWRDKAAGHDELRAAVRAGIEQAGERNLSRVFLRGALADSEQSLAEARAENARLRAERDAAWQAGAEAMREAAAAAAVNVHNVRIIGCRMGSDWINGHRIGSYDAYDAIRALPLPGQPTNNEENT